MRNSDFSLDSFENRGIFPHLAADGRPRGVVKMNWLKTNKINPASFARVGATCGQSLFAYRPAANDLTKETPPPR
jgi:hypothetical protein